MALCAQLRLPWIDQLFTAAPTTTASSAASSATASAASEAGVGLALVDQLLAQNSKSAAAATFELSRSVTSFAPPSLISLPHNYSDLHEETSGHVCAQCETLPKDPALCLVCGRMLCCGNACCRSGADGELSLHTQASAEFASFYSFASFDGHSTHFFTCVGLCAGQWCVLTAA